MADNHTLESLLREVRAADYCSSKLEWVAPVCELFEVLVATVRAQDERIGELEQRLQELDDRTRGSVRVVGLRFR